MSDTKENKGAFAKTYCFTIQSELYVTANGKSEAYSKIGQVLDSNYLVTFEGIKITLEKMIEKRVKDVDEDDFGV